MNTRVLELIRNPRTITESDLKILKSESDKMPYAQSIRALYLYGVNLYDSDSYKENLSKTAAYTTDKKILYQFINSQFSNYKTDTEISEFDKIDKDEPIGNEKLNIETDEIVNSKKTEIAIHESEAKKSELLDVKITSNEELKEDISNTKENNQLKEINSEDIILNYKDDNYEKNKVILISDIQTQEESEDYQKDIVNNDFKIHEDEISISNKEVHIEDEYESISYNNIDNFLPDVKFSIPSNHFDYLNPPKIQIEKDFLDIVEDDSEETYDIENKSNTLNTETDNIQIHQKELANIDVEKKLPNLELDDSENDYNIDSLILSSNDENVFEEEAIAWKPMSFLENVPDALIGLKDEAERATFDKDFDQPIISEQNIVLDHSSNQNKNDNDEELERPIMNVSFFGNQVSKIKDERVIPEIIEKQSSQNVTDSNISSFINTWQSWLKIDRNKEEPIGKDSFVKEKIINQFIENNPKITQLKDEINYVVKEKKDDISHLMTETLANLYLEQKLFSKAIKSYEILIEKHPQKTAYFIEKIEEIRENRKS